MIKKAYITNMSYDVTTEEKKQAMHAISCFKRNQKILDGALDHLNIIYTSFKDAQNADPKENFNHRSAFRRFRDKVVENFNHLKKSSLECVKSLTPFSSDTQVVKITKSFISSIDILEDKINDFVKLFESIDSKDFISNAIKSIDSIKIQSEELQDLMKDRVKKYIQENILSENWMNQVSKDLDLKLQKRTPLLLRLYNEE